MLAWTMYAGDNTEHVPNNNDPTPTVTPPWMGGPSWAAGIMDWNAGLNSANTNLLLLTTPSVASLAPYIGLQVKLYWCPADHFLSGAQHGWTHRDRSVAMDAAVGGGHRYSFPWSAGPPPFFVATKTSQFLHPGFSQSWVFIDEHPDAIDDIILYVNPNEATGIGQFTELPSDLHNNACGVGFADGHGEIHKWTDSRTLVPVIYNGSNARQINISGTPSPDLAWLAQCTPLGD